MGVLFFTRMSGLVLIAPMFAARIVPSRIRAAVLVALVLALMPAALGHSVAQPVVSASTILAEALVGLTLGFGAAVFVGAAESAGDTLAVQMGLSGANILDPLSHTQMPVLGQFMGLVAMAFILSVDGHLLMIEPVSVSMDAIPLGGAIRLEEGLAGLVLIGGRLFALGLLFAAPVVGAMMIGNATLGVLARTVPQLNVLMVAFPLQIGIGLLALGLSLPLLATYFSSWPVMYGDTVQDLLGRFMPDGS